ncbi:MAG: type III pantothenate kinase, partial [Cyclobacteriaceae bacterium]|nr:type III pantothenate kinase [Cyclobacteriaceae bacterium]
MNLVIDAGNTRTKIGIFEEALLKTYRVFEDHAAAADYVKSLDADHAMISSVTDQGKTLIASLKVKGKLLVLTPQLSLPIENRYGTPGTLGADRLAAACGAWQLFPRQSSLVIDCGTCINYEFVHAHGYYAGGAISPGLSMRLRSMHEMTSRLPLASPATEVPLTGTNTVECLQSGVMNGVLEEIKGVMERYRKTDPGIRVILTGGDAHFFEKPLKPFIFVAPELVLTGLNSILLH